MFDQLMVLKWKMFLDCLQYIVVVYWTIIAGMLNNTWEIVVGLSLLSGIL